MEEGSVHFTKRPRSVRGDNEQNDICDLDDNELNQLQKLYFKYLPMSSLLRDTQ